MTKRLTIFASIIALTMAGCAADMAADPSTGGAGSQSAEPQLPESVSLPPPPPAQSSTSEYGGFADIGGDGDGEIIVTGARIGDDNNEHPNDRHANRRQDYHDREKLAEEEEARRAAISAELDGRETERQRRRSEILGLDTQQRLLSENLYRDSLAKNMASGSIGHSLPALASDEELWIISQPADASADLRDAAGPGTGSLIVETPSRDRNRPPEIVPLPLKHTAVNATIDGYISSVDVRQQFHNPFDTKIEAKYLFPLPEKSAISGFTMIIGDRKIRGILREKEEAEAIYDAARAQGYRASLLVQHRPNIFEQKVANIEPGKQIDVEIRYFHTLKYEDGWYSFVFPTVVGPRYNPPGHADPIVPAAQGRSAASSAATTVEYLRPGQRSGHDISIAVDIEAGVSIEEIEATHPIETVSVTQSGAVVMLADEDVIPNQDFVLRFQVAGEQMKSNLLTYVDPETEQGYFTMMLHPPAGTVDLERQPMEMVFVIDASGSMRGTPLDQAKDAIRAALDQLQPYDTFQIIRFSDNASQFGNAPVPASPANIALAKQYLQGVNSSGGTRMVEGVAAALQFPHDPARLRFVSFMTDGYIGNEFEILGAISQHIGDSRIFSFGIGSSTNRFLLERMAVAGRGAAAFLGPMDSGYDLMSAFFNRISHPALRDVAVDWGSMAVSDVYPSNLPDVFVGRPVIVTGKFLGPAGNVTIKGRSGTQVATIEIEPAADERARPMLAKIWARQRIADLVDLRAMGGYTNDPYFEVMIRTTALTHQLVSDYTSFVAVDASEQTAGTYGVTVPQAVPVPAGVRYDTTVPE
ncbi:MAG: VIT and VWA domain-containing protein [Pseudomonadota bacterium]